MSFQDLVPSVRESLGVSSTYDTDTIPAGIRRATVFLLRGWTFPQALEQDNFPFNAGANVIALPISGVGMIKAVRLRNTDGSEVKRLRRTLIGEGAPLATSLAMPTHYWQEGNRLVMNTSIPTAGYSADVWYNNTDPYAAEPWITQDFEDILFTLSVMRLAQDLRKPEVQAAFAATWQEMVPTMAQYLNEVEFNDMDIRMKPDVSPTPPVRYGT